MTPRTTWKVTEVAHLGGDRLVIVQGELDVATAPELGDLLRRLLLSGHAVRLDLGDVTFMDSNGLTILMDAHVDATTGNASFSVVRASPPVRRVVALAGAERLLAS